MTDPAILLKVFYSEEDSYLGTEPSLQRLHLWPFYLDKFYLISVHSFPLYTVSSRLTPLE